MNDEILRFGTVSSVNAENRTARVFFDDTDGVSGELRVLQRSGSAVNIQTAFDDDRRHTHGAATGVWLPAVGEMVACLYLPTFGGDGLILGGL